MRVTCNLHIERYLTMIESGEVESCEDQRCLPFM